MPSGRCRPSRGALNQAKAHSNPERFMTRFAVANSGYWRSRQTPATSATN